MRAAIDCQRAGLLRPLPVDWLQALHLHYLPGPSAPELFTRGLEWATRPLNTQTALLSRAHDGQPEAYVPYDYIVDHASREGRPINSAVWDRVIDEYAKDEPELLTATVVAYVAGDFARAERAARHADERGSPVGAISLGALLQGRGDPEGAEDAYRRADERGHAEGAFELGVLLRERNLSNRE